MCDKYLDQSPGLSSRAQGAEGTRRRAHPLGLRAGLGQIVEHVVLARGRVHRGHLLQRGQRRGRRACGRARRRVCRHLGLRRTELVQSDTLQAQAGPGVVGSDHVFLSQPLDSLSNASTL